MLIKLEAVKDSMLGKAKAKEVIGTRLDNGEEWKKKFFSNNKELSDQLAEFPKGGIVNVVLTKEGEWYNITAFKEATKAEMETATSAPKTKFVQKSQDVRRADGGSRGDDTNRSAAIYLAQEIVSMSEYDGLTAEQLAVKIAYIANTFIYPYIKEGTCVPFEGKKKKDPLDPPDID